MTGVDVSNNNSQIDWDQAHPHVAFAIAKASQGTGFRDGEFDRNRSECARLGVAFGAYHWLEPAEMYGAPNEIVDQIRWFRQVVGPVADGEIINTLDIETTEPHGGRRIGSPSPNDVELAVRVHEDEFGHTPIAYGGQSVLLPCAWVRPEITRCRLWKAIYPGANTGDPAVKSRGYGRIDPWPAITMWQWTSQGAGSVPGVASSGLDLNDLLAPLDTIRVGGHLPPPIGDDDMGVCIPRWALPIDPAGTVFPFYTFDLPMFRAWYGAPIPDGQGQVPNPQGLPCVEIDTTGWLAGHAAARGPFMAEGGRKVCVYRDDGAPLVYLTGHSDAETDPAPAPPDPQVLAGVVAQAVSALPAEAARLVLVELQRRLQP